MIKKIYDGIKNISHLDVTAKDRFSDDKPVGVTIHYTAERSVKRTINSLMEKDLGYHLIIERDGSVIQMTSLIHKCWHAGRAVWNGRSPNHHHIAIALCSWGFVTQQPGGHYAAWCGDLVEKEDLVFSRNICGNMMAWDHATKEQMSALRGVIAWLIASGINPGEICGHDECAIPRGRKLDPGGVLPYTVSDMREMLLARTGEGVN